MSLIDLPLCRLLCQQVCCSGFCRVCWAGTASNWKRWRQDHYCVPVLHQHRHVWWLSNKVSAYLFSTLSRGQMSDAARVDEALPLVKAFYATGCKTRLESCPWRLDRTDMCTSAYVHVVNGHGRHVVQLVNVDIAVTKRADPTFSNIINAHYNA